MGKTKKNIRLLFCVFLLLFVVFSGHASAAEFDLVLNQSDSPDPVIAGAVVTYNLRVTNDSFDNAINNIQLTDTLPTGHRFCGRHTQPG